MAQLGTVNKINIDVSVQHIAKQARVEEHRRDYPKAARLREKPQAGCRTNARNAGAILCLPLTPGKARGTSSVIIKPSAIYQRLQ